MQNHAHELVRAGIQVSAHGIQDVHTVADLPGWNGAEIHAHPPSVEKFAYSRQLAYGLDQARPDIVHLHGLWQYPSLVADRWRRRTGGPVIISTQGMLEPWALQNSRWRKRAVEWLFERRNLSRAAVIHCSRSEVAGIREFGLNNPVAVLPNGATLPNHTARLDRPAFMETSKRHLLFLGRLHPKKGITETLTGWARLKANNPALAQQWRLVVAGWDDGGHEARFRAEAQALGIAEVVQFPGPLFGEDKKAALTHADAFILASHSEGFPMGVMEAWASALPVFMTAQCNIPEGFDAGSAFEVTTDPDSIATVLARQLAGHDLPDAGWRGREMVAARFSWPVIAAELAAVYRWTLRRQEKPACVELA